MCDHQWVQLGIVSVECRLCHEVRISESILPTPPNSRIPMDDPIFDFDQ